MIVRIGRSSGPVTDLPVESDFGVHELELVKDVIAMVNRVTRDREGWWVEVEAEGEGGKSVESVIPTLS